VALGHALQDILEIGEGLNVVNNSVERAIRPVALGRKNHLFAGSDGGADRRWPYRKGVTDRFGKAPPPGMRPSCVSSRSSKLSLTP
jgi:hypothetical protein